jgi:hypothetical protein
MSAAIAAVLVTWKIGRGQLSIAKEQRAISQQQANTAALQAQLANIRLQHDLYDRRYKMYEVVKQFIIKIYKSLVL